MRCELRRAVIGDEPVLRALRLPALTDSPTAFSSTYERELARTTEGWRRRQACDVASKGEILLQALRTRVREISVSAGNLS